MTEYNLILEGLNIAEKIKLMKEGCINSCFFNSNGSLTKEYSWVMKEKQKYFYLDIGSSGAFMIDKATGEVFNIKGYGTPNKKKFYGVAINTIEFGIKLHSLRWDYRR